MDGIIKVVYDSLSYEGGGTLSPKKVINLPRTYKKLPCNGEPYRFID